jgi:N-acetylglucosaminyl-diphospho-decaprenol L-rhamnosyltransferase
VKEHFSRLGIVIVTHNHASDISSCLDALAQPGNAASAQIVVRDCGSADETVAIAEEHPLAPIVIRGANIGFGPGCNDAAATLGDSVDMLLFLNPDTALGFALDELLTYIGKFERLGCVGVQQRDPSGKSIVWSWDLFPSPRLEWLKAMRRPLLQRSADGYTRDLDADWVMGSFLLIPRRVFAEVGGFDERFFLFNEEVDLCHRIKDSGYRVVHVNEFVYFHRRDNKDTLWREIVRINSRRIYDDKWLGHPAQFVCKLAQSYRWLTHLVRPTKPSDRRWAIPRLLATWNLLHAQTPHRRGRIRRPTKGGEATGPQRGRVGSVPADLSADPAPRIAGR